MNNDAFMKLRAGDAIDVRLTIVEFDNDRPDNDRMLIASTASGDKCFVRPAHIENVANYRVKASDCVDYIGSANGSGWGVVQSIITETEPTKGTRWVLLWRFNERDKAPVVIRESEVTGRKPLPDGYEWPRKVAT